MMVAVLTNAGMLRDIITLNFGSDFLTFLVMALLLVALAVTRNKRFHMEIPALLPLAGFLMILFN
jgi:hypothetical protein